jgi:hypothetical protein
MERAQAHHGISPALQHKMPANRIGQGILILDRLDIDAAGFNTTRHDGQDHFLRGWI